MLFATIISPGKLIQKNLHQQTFLIVIIARHIFKMLSSLPKGF